MATSIGAAGHRSTAPGSSTPDPTGERGFLVRIDGLEIGRFAECSGLQVEFEVLEYEEGGENGYVHKLRGRAKHPNLVLKRGVTHEDALLRWFLECRQEVKPHDGHVSLVGPDGRAVRTWSFAGAFPVKWQGPTLSAGSSNVATETLEIAHAGLRPEGA